MNVSAVEQTVALPVEKPLAALRKPLHILQFSRVRLRTAVNGRLVRGSAGVTGEALTLWPFASVQKAITFSPRAPLKRPQASVTRTWVRGPDGGFAAWRRGKCEREALTSPRESCVDWKLPELPPSRSRSVSCNWTMKTGRKKVIRKSLRTRL